MNQLVHDGLLTLEEALEVLHGAGITTEEYADAEYLQPGEEDDDEDEDEGEAECENENGDSDSDGPPTKRVVSYLLYPCSQTACLVQIGGTY